MLFGSCCCDCDCEAPGASPTAAFSYQQTGDDPCTISLTDESTAGTCGPIVSWSWKVEGVEVSTSQNPTGIEVVDGDEVSLTVTDSKGCTSDVTAALISCVDCDTEGPTADFSYIQSSCDAPWAVDFTDESVGGACGDIVSWSWDFGDGDTSTSQNPTHSFDDGGPFDVTLTVTDACGCQDSVVMEVAPVTGYADCVGCDALVLDDEIEIEVSGIVGGTQSCANCPEYNGTFILTRVGACEWEYTETVPTDAVGFTCGITAVEFNLLFTNGPSGTGRWVLGGGYNGTTFAIWQLDDDCTDYQSQIGTQITLPLNSSSTIRCNPTSAVAKLTVPNFIFC